jgi:hypothetical protein
MRERSPVVQSRRTDWTCNIYQRNRALHALMIILAHIYNDTEIGRLIMIAHAGYYTFSFVCNPILNHSNTRLPTVKPMPDWNVTPIGISTISNSWHLPYGRILLMWTVHRRWAATLKRGTHAVPEGYDTVRYHQRWWENNQRTITARP